MRTRLAGQWMTTYFDTLLTQKTVGPLQHLRLHVRGINTFNEALEMIYSYIRCRHLTVPSGRADRQGQPDMDIGALKRGKGQWKGKGHKGTVLSARRSKHAQRKHAKMSAVTDDENQQGQGDGWNDDWNQWNPESGRLV